MGSGFAKKKKEARNIQEQFQKFNEEMKQTSCEGSASGGMVKITLNGEHKMLDIKINPECIDKDDAEGLADLIRVAYHNALEKVEAKAPKLPSMPNIPGLEGLFSQ